MKKIFIWVALMLICATPMLAVPAFNDWIKFRQPNTETIITIMLKGDEKVHWAESEEGYSLLYGPEGALYYAMSDNKGGMEPSTYLALPKEQLSHEAMIFLSQTPKHLRFSKDQINSMLSMWNIANKSKSGEADPLGDRRCLVILFAFQDQAFVHTRTEFENLFNQVGYSVNHATGSVHDYYYDVSHGQFNLQVDIVGPITGTRNTAFYGDGSYSANQAFAEEAVDSASKYIDFSDYDNDGDGYIEGLHIIFAGVGEEAGGGEDKIWSHKWNIFSNPVYNNTVVNLYSCSPECAGSGNSMDAGSVSPITNIGVICHELGHVFGAPDYYDTDYQESGGQFPGLGQWDIMSSGSWNNSGKTPAHHNPYTKIYIYHWATCDTLTSTQQVHMEPVATNNHNFHRVNTSTEGDFFLLENRQKIKWDNDLPGKGMLVYHIHPNANGRSVSNYQHPQQIYILAHTSDTFPNSNPSSYGSLNVSSAPFPGTMRRSQLTDNTCPWFRPWSGTPNNAPITYISESSSTGIVSFCFKGAQPQSYNLSATGVSDSTIRLDWTNWGSMKAMVLCSKENVFGTPTHRYYVGDTVEGGGIVMLFNTSNSAYCNNLEPNTTYYFRVYNLENDSTFLPNHLEAEGITLSCTATDWELEDFDGLTSLPDCWTGNNWSVSNGVAVAHPSSADEPCVLEASPVRFTRSTTPYNVSFRTSIDPTSDGVLELRYRSSIQSEWETIKTVTHKDCSEADGWGHVCATLPDVSSYSLLQFVYTGGAGRDGIYLDDIEFKKGYLVHVTSTVGGSVNNEGYNISQKNDTIIFNIQREPGYKFANLYIDGELATNQVHNNQYLLKVRKHVELKFTFMGTDGIEDVHQVQLKAYPNPTTGILHVEVEGADNVMLYDIYGRKLRSIKAEQASAIDMSDLPHGIYLLRAGSKTNKIIKK